jgi:tetratricopeptide (TPR) repeat protein
MQDFELIRKPIASSICLLACLLGFCFLAMVPNHTRAGELEDCRSLLWSGEYDTAIQIAKEKVDAKTWNEGWSRLLIEGYILTGKYEEAVAVFESVKERYYSSLTLRLLAIDAYRFSNQQAKANVELETIPIMLERSPWQYTTRDQLVPLGKFFVISGEDARKVLEQCFDRVLKQDPQMVDAHIASAELALQKEDATVALTALQKAEKLQPANPHIFYLMATAWSNSDSQRASEALQRALKLNPKHLDSLLLTAENRIDAEDYTSAQKLLDEIEKVNPRHFKLWALRSVIYHLKGDFSEEENARKKALETWPLNPEVDYLIGRKLSQHYLFRQGVEHQRFALEMDANYIPAKSQLAQDLLRLGETDEGWRLVADVRKADSYNITVFNLRQLQENLDKFATLESPGFVVRMDAKEAELYGDAVLNLLSEARSVLTSKYKAELEEPIYVEIFPRQSDFAIRTFGMPGGEGFLGVCFGRLITANSPAAQGATPSNWQSVLWHEYCHVVTLQKSKNRMPRWLSEGISVYEETVRKRAWGMPMDPTYRAMILGEYQSEQPTTPPNLALPSTPGIELFEPLTPTSIPPRVYLKPISQMSSAFMDAESPLEMQFAYFQSSLAVSFLIEKFGVESLQQILDSLAKGLSIQDALQRHTAPLEQVDNAFAEYAKNAANTWGKEAVFTKIEFPDFGDDAAWKVFFESQPNHVPAIQAYLVDLLRREEFELALPWTDRLESLLPEDSSLSGVWGLKARVLRGLKKTDQERTALIELTTRNADAVDALQRLVDIDQEQQRWPDVVGWCNEILAVNPFLSSVHSARADAAMKSNAPKIAADSYKAILQLEPLDPAEAHLKYAQACAASDQLDLAERHALMAIEEAPRYQEALRFFASLKKKRTLPSHTISPDLDAQPPTPENVSSQPAKAEVNSQ